MTRLSQGYCKLRVTTQPPALLLILHPCRNQSSTQRRRLEEALNVNKGGNYFVGKLAKGIGAALLCVGLLLSVGLVKGTTAATPQETQKKEKTKPNPDQEKGPDQGNTVTVSGKVATISDAKVTIVNDQKAELTVALTPDTKITKGGKEVTVSDVKADDLVTILARKGDGDSLMAVRIVVS